MTKLKTLLPQTGVAFTLLKNHYLEVIDPQGEQVADLYAVMKEDWSDSYSAGRSIDYNETIYFTVGHLLYSHSGKPMLEIVEDSCGRHDTLVTPCSLQMFQMIHKNKNHHPSCLGNLTSALKDFPIPESQITSTFNIFMNITVDSMTGKITILPPRSTAGQKIIFKACEDLILGLTACSDEATNNGFCKPIQYQTFV